MRSRWFFLTILSVLFFYTGHKLSFVWPRHRVIVWSITSVVFATMIGSQILYRSGEVSPDAPWFRFLIWTGTLLLGCWGIFVMFSLMIDVFRIFNTIARAAVPGFGAKLATDEARRDLIFRWTQTGLLTFSAGAAAVGYIQTALGPNIREVKIPVPNLPRDLVGFRIAQISDLHVGPTIQKNYVEDVVTKVLDTKPDLIAVTGDLADGVPEQLEQHLEPLRKLKAKYGTYYVTGNHEYYWSGLSWLKKAQDLGFIPLINQNKTIQVGASKILCAGVTDTSADQFIPNHKSDPQKAAQTHDQCDFRLLLAHRPDSCVEAAPAGFHLQLSGHTHAGQFFPFTLIVRMVHKYFAGLNKHENLWVYVNAGTGYWGPANRFLVPSEVTLIELTAV